MIQIRIGDLERDAAAARLGENFAQGRLNHEEFNERLDAIWSARTRADLDQLFYDLPRPAVTQRASRPAPMVRRGMRHVLPMLVIAVLVGVAILKAGPWVLLIAAVWFVFLRPRRQRRIGHDRPGVGVSRSVRAHGS